MDSEKKPQEGLGFVVACANCGHSRLVYREEILAGNWQTCPECEARDKEC